MHKQSHQSNVTSITTRQRLRPGQSLQDQLAVEIAGAWRKNGFGLPPEYRGDTSGFDRPDLSESEWAAAVAILGAEHDLHDIVGTVGVNRSGLAVLRAEGLTISDTVHWIIDNPCPCCVAEGRR